jgi:hypothetical protein
MRRKGAETWKACRVVARRSCCPYFSDSSSMHLYVAGSTLPHGFLRRNMNCRHKPEHARAQTSTV